jgi:virginiamycin B lyase
VTRRLGWVAAITFLISGCAPNGTPSGLPSTFGATGAVPPTATAPGPATGTGSTLGGGQVPIQSLGATRIDVSGEPDWLALAGGNVWAAVVGGIRKIDAATGKVDGLVPVDDTICLAMDVGFDSLWAGGCGKHQLYRVVPSSGLLFTPPIDLPIPAIREESSLAAGEGGVWVVSSDHRLVRVDPVRNRADPDPWPLPDGAAAVRAGLGALWVTVPATDTLLKLSPADPSAAPQSIKVGDGPRFLAIGPDAVWVMDQGSGSVTRVDAGGNVVATIPVSDRPIEGGDIAVGGGSVWVRTKQDLVVRIDPRTNQVNARLGPASGSGSVVADDGTLWVSAHDVESVWRLPLH